MRAVAVQAVLGLVEPQSSGLGGGAFMTFYDARTRKVTAYNGRETAPAGATPDMFMAGGKPMGYVAAVTSGRSAGVPGAVAMLAMAHKDHGKLAWSALFDDAERGANARITVDLESQTISGPDGGTISFEIDPFRKHCLLNGLDDIGLTQVKADKIKSFEATLADERPWA